MWVGGVGCGYKHEHCKNGIKKLPKTLPRHTTPVHATGRAEQEASAEGNMHKRSGNTTRPIAGLCNALPKIGSIGNERALHPSEAPKHIESAQCETKESVHTRPAADFGTVCCWPGARALADTCIWFL